MGTFTTVIIWIDIAFVVIFLLRFLVPSFGPAVESLLIRLFKKDKGSSDEEE